MDGKSSGNTTEEHRGIKLRFCIPIGDGFLLLAAFESNACPCLLQTILLEDEFKVRKGEKTQRKTYAQNTSDTWIPNLPWKAFLEPVERSFPRVPRIASDRSRTDTEVHGSHPIIDVRDEKLPGYHSRFNKD